MQFWNEKNIKIICTVAGALILCAALIVCGIYLGRRDDIPEVSEETEDITTEESTTAPEVEIIVGEDEIPEEAETREEGEYKLTLSDLEIGDTSWAYFLVNRTNYVPQGYEDNLNLEGVWSNGRYYYFDARIADFAECMINDAERDGVTLLICSAYRSHASQTANFESQIKAYAGAKYSFADAYTYTSRYIAIPGTSEHQTGLAVDFITPGYMYLDDGFENTDAYKWLSENSYKYGFILRYPSSKAAETGINYEPWHFRFIGFENAEDIYNSGLCLEEYMLAEGSVQFNPMAPLVIPAEPSWYQSYINPPEPETEEIDTEEVDTDTSEETESDTQDEYIPEWLQTESDRTVEEELDDVQTDFADDTETEELQTSDETSDAEDVTDDELSDTEDITEDETFDSEDLTEDETTALESEEDTDEEETTTQSATDEDTAEEITSEETIDENTTDSEDVTEEEE